jgi:hypothetical protein
MTHQPRWLRESIIRAPACNTQGYLRSLFTAGALAVIRYARIHGSQHRPWLTALLARKPTKVVLMAQSGLLERGPPHVRF